MTEAALPSIKKELQNLDATALAELCMQLAKFKKDNKEYLSYLLFDAHDKETTIVAIKQKIDVQFSEVNTNQLYFVKKTLRKILSGIAKYAKYLGNKQHEAELLIYFCTKVKQLNLPLHKNLVLENLYNNQIKKVTKLIATLHEDLQYDFEERLTNLTIDNR